jgi:hypothetical protein
MTIVLHQFNQPEYFAHEFMTDPALKSPALAALEQPFTSPESNTINYTELEKLEEASSNSTQQRRRDWSRFQYYLLSSFLVLLPIVSIAYCLIFNRELIRDNYFLQLSIQFFFVVGFYVIFAITASFFGYSPLFSNFFIKASSMNSDSFYKESDYGTYESGDQAGLYSKEGHYFGVPQYNNVIPNPTPLFVYTVPVDETEIRETLQMCNYHD